MFITIRQQKIFSKFIFGLITFYLFFPLFSNWHSPHILLAESSKFTSLKKKYFFPKEHDLQKVLASLFTDAKMFRSVDHFMKAGFKVKKERHELMIAYHPSLPSFLFKKYSMVISQAEQLNNYIKRVKGAHTIRECIEKHHFKNLVVPQKWIYPLPNLFTKELGRKSFILIVENMNILSNKENEILYYHMDKEILKELCTVLHEVEGCDAFPRNQPFTRSGKIAFIDTEHVGEKKGHFFKHIVPFLNKELQAYAKALWKKLEKDKKKK